jgi:hypothetical protein
MANRTVEGRSAGVEATLKMMSVRTEPIEGLVQALDGLAG